ncbi:hypothetical protein [Clostridium tertium]|uniref:Polysaccharide pyruvyl transferase n=1 Tax=Clostridium tertium TaxID=1559 RepID=A0A6N3ENB6_9CLOT
MKKNIRIGFTGPISEINFGDYAMFINNVYDIGIKNITIFSYNKEFSENIIKDYFNGFNISLVEVELLEKKYDEVKEDKKKSIPKVGILPFNHPTETPIDILYRIKNLYEIRKYIKEIDLLIVSGGGYFNHLWNNSLWRSDMLKKIVAPMIIAKQFNKKIIFTANSFGPFDQSEEFFNYLFNYLKNTTFAVRDRMYSRGYLERINIESSQIKFLPDDLYIINEDIIKLPSKNNLDINRLGKYIAVEIYLSLDDIKKYISDIKRFSDNIYARYGLSIVFIPFDFERGGMWQCDYLKENLKNFYFYDINKTGYMPIQDLYKIIKNAEMVLCTRYHALVLSVGYDIPVVNIIKKVCDDNRYYFNKNYGLLEYAFDGLEFNEMDYIKIDFLETLKYIENNFYDIIKKQKEIYKSNIYNYNKKNLKKIRKEYLELIKLEDKNG